MDAAFLVSRYVFNSRVSKVVLTAVRLAYFSVYCRSGGHVKRRAVRTLDSAAPAPTAWHARSAAASALVRGQLCINWDVLL